MGLHDWASESSRQSGNSEKARRNISLELRFHLKLDERRRPRFRARFGPKEIKVAPDRDAASKRDVKRLEARIGRLHASTILAVLNPCVVYLQLPFWRYDILGAITFVKQISKYAKFTIIIGIINQSRFWVEVFQTQVFCEKPDDTNVGREDLIVDYLEDRNG